MKFLTAGESHGKALIGIIEGLPCGLKIDLNIISEMLERRRNAIGRGERQKICSDKAEILSGLSGGVTTGAPLAIIIENGNCGKSEFDFFRPGHVDYAAFLKYGYAPYLGAERASARETAMRTAIGAVAKQLLSALNIDVFSQVLEIGGETDEKRMEEALNKAKNLGDTLGGKLRVTVCGLKAGVGSHVYWTRRLDARLSGALMSIPAVKAVESGAGAAFASMTGKQAVDPIAVKEGRIVRLSNNCGGLEGGISNGEDVTFTLTVKPIPSVEGVQTIDQSGRERLTGKVRGDVCAAIPAAVVAEAVVSFEVADAIMECFGGDTVDEILKRYKEKGSDSIAEDSH